MGGPGVSSEASRADGAGDGRTDVGGGASSFLHADDKLPPDRLHVNRRGSTTRHVLGWIYLIYAHPDFNHVHGRRYEGAAALKMTARQHGRRARR